MSETKQEAPSIKVLTPAYMGNVSTKYFHSVVNLGNYLSKVGVAMSVETLPNCSLISLGRNIMVKRALEDPNWTHIMWIDSDIEFDPRCVHSMLRDDKDIVGGLYPKKGLPIDFASAPMPGGEMTQDLVETDYVATGFMLIKRKVITDMIEAFPERRFFYQGSDEFYDLFSPYIDTEMSNRLYLTEDYAFCRLARKIGYRSFMSLRFTLGHHGVFTFSKDNEEQMLKEYERMGYIEIKQMTPDWEKISKEEGKTEK